MSADTAATLRCLVACSNCKRQFDASGFAPGSQFHCACGEIIEVQRFRSHDAAVVRCSSCSAPRKQGAFSCEHCGADYTLHERDLHTICPTCMTRVSDRARYCHHCATPIVPEPGVGRQTKRTCPACGKRHKLTSRTLGKSSIAVLECPRCAGMWLGREAFQALADGARAETLPEGVLPDTGRPADSLQKPAAPRGGLYRRCAECDKHMNRRNFGQRSGIVIDSCKEHGIWFDAEELNAILTWIRQGGEARAQARTADEKRHAARQQRINLEPRDRTGEFGTSKPTAWQRDPGMDLGSLLGALFDL